VYAAAALTEIVGCFGFWLWLRQGRSPWVLVAAMSALGTFAWLLTLVETNVAGRAYASYGGVYVVASLAWLWLVEGVRPDRWDLAGGALCLAGATIIIFGPRVS